MSPLTPKTTRILLVLLLTALAVGHAGLALFAIREKSPAFDEPAHITGGYTFNVLDDFRMHPENGLLPQRWQALPASLQGLRYPDLDRPAWRTSNVWQTGQALLYETGNDTHRLLMSARAMNTLFGLATVLLVAAWARWMFGWTGAFVAALFAALCPTLLAHSPLATSDMAITFFLLAATGAWWWHLHDQRAGVWLLSLATFSLACVAKYTAVLLLPLFLLLALVRGAHPLPLTLGGQLLASSRSRLAFLAGTSLLHGLTAVAVIWAFCGFRYSAFNPALPAGDFPLPWEALLTTDGLAGRIVGLCRDWRLLPEGFLYGFAFVLKHAEARAAFLDGQLSLHGWVSFFPKAFLYKTPPSLLLALLAGGILSLFKARAEGIGHFRLNLYRSVPLLCLFFLYWGVSLGSNLNIGHRHILPTYPILYILTGALGWAVLRAWENSRAAGLGLGMVLAALLGWHTAIATRIHPHYLAYFSPVAGGPEQGYRHLVDSSLDWGQDLPGLRRWLATHRQPGEPVYLSYFGTADPAFHGISAAALPSYPPIRQAGPGQPLRPGLYVISSTMLSQMLSPFRGDWTDGMEARFQQGRGLENILLDDENHALGPDLTPRQWSQIREDYEQLRFARLCLYLRLRKPDDQIGYSLQIYRLTPAEIDAVAGSITALTEAIAQTVGPVLP